MPDTETTQLAEMTPRQTRLEVPAGSWRDWVRLLRMPHWAKNLVVFPAVVLVGRAGNPEAWVWAGWVFAAFCLASSAVYIVNDVFDREADRLHPVKRKRPIVSGRVPVGPALMLAALLAMASMVVSLGASVTALLCVAVYLVLNILYDAWLKHIPLLDACCVASGFVLRLVATLGVGLIAMRVSSLLASTFVLCIFVALCKRAAEMQTMEAAGGGNGGRRSLDGYTREALPRMIAASGGLTVAAYMLFVITVGHHHLIPMLTVVPVVYCLLRFAKVSVHGDYVDQISLVRSDVRLMTAVVIWAALWTLFVVVR